ncbi:GNAT family N-acetyltransferase [Myroides odoratimimus]|uniref:GNAT family N-acetyltransferase n=1 Tax=Myroides odoratimimus TaxID=76832 RepID=UPI0025758C37|nr:GNAT family N-acetyltransferase [Myroides odoratimimus]MDM1396560.1 GNAT family N-acetyltransferase [Myroides odoratimimus]
MPFICLNIYVFYPLAKLILKEDLKRLNDTQNRLYADITELKKQNKEYAEELTLISNQKKRFTKFVQEDKLKNCDVSLTENYEIVFISKSQTSGTTLNLYGSDSTYHYRDSHIFYSNIFDEAKKVVKIHDLISYTIKKGYAKALMIQFIKNMKNEGVNVIKGDLSPVDQDSFSWLIPFYESLGFTCTLFTPDPTKMLGEIEMVIKQN